MYDILTQNDLTFLTDGELGENILHLVRILELNDTKNKILVDLGVETGKSSKVLLHKSLEKNNKVFGVDPIKCVAMPGVMNHPNYTFLKNDSVAAGKNWKNLRPFIIFIDSVHAKEQVLRELYYWWDLLEVGGTLVFHDTEWENYIHKASHPCAGKKPGNSGLGYDYYMGRVWETPDKAIKQFFNIPTLNYENDIIQSIHYPTSLGMTYIKKKSENDYKKTVTNWEKIENDRLLLLSVFSK